MANNWTDALLEASERAAEATPEDEPIPPKDLQVIVVELWERMRVLEAQVEALQAQVEALRRQQREQPVQGRLL